LILTEDTGFEERLHQIQDATIPDSGPHPVHETDMRDFVEARFDVPLKHPLIRAAGEEVDLLDGILGSAPGAETVGARLEVRLEDRLEHQLEGGLHAAIACGRDAEPAKLAPLFGDELLPHGQGDEPSSLEIISQPGKERLLAEHDGARLHPIDPCRPCPSVTPHPIPRHRKEGGIGDEIEEVVEPTMRVVGSPLM
jgi:hypothetical protein